MKITIAYLYYDLLNLYGESGNIKILKHQLENQDIKVNIKLLTIGDELNFDDYDFVYIGSGTEHNQKIALNHLLSYKEEIKQEIMNNKFFLATGNSIELFGKYILDNEEKNDALEIFDYYSITANKRLIDESVFSSRHFNELIIGFQNQSKIIKNNNEPIFTVIKGIGSNLDEKAEGIHYNNFYGTYLIGPFLVRNPHILKHIIKDLVLSKDKKFNFKEFDLDLEIKAHNHFINTFYPDLN